MWKKIIGQSNLKKIFVNIISKNKFANSYIFYGKEGIGKDAFAIELAKIFNCINYIEKSGACDECKYCRQIQNLNSPLVKFIIALPTGKKKTQNEDPLTALDSESYQIYLEELNLKSNNLYYKINIPDANSIRIDSIRNLINEANFTIETNKKKFFIISECDKLNEQSSNALLKILEEPPKNSHFILTTSKPQTLLPTIWGRCQKIKFDNISDDELKLYINSNNTNLSTDEINLIVQLSNGSLSICKDIMHSYFFELREDVLKLLRAIIQNKYIEIHKCILKICSGKDKMKQKQALAILILWFRDINISNLGKLDFITNKDKKDNLNRYIINYHSHNFQIIKLIDSAIKDIDTNVNPESLLFNLSFGIRSLISEKVKS